MSVWVELLVRNWDLVTLPCMCLALAQVLYKLGVCLPSLWLCELGVKFPSLRLYVPGVYWPSIWSCMLGVGLSTMRCMLGVFLPCATAVLPYA